MSSNQAQLYFTVERYSHHFVVKDMSPMGMAAVDRFASQFVQYGLEKRGRFFQRVPVKVFAARCRANGEARFHTGQWKAWKKFLADRGIPEACYKESQFGFIEAAPLNAVVKDGWVAHDYQVPIIDYLQSPLPEPRKLVEIQPGKGKSQPGSAKVLTAGGWTRMDSIAVGEVIITQDGSLTDVVEVYENGLRPMLRLTTEDGRETIADKEHLWRINYTENGKTNPCVINTDHARVLIESGKSVFLPLALPDYSMASLSQSFPKLVADCLIKGACDEELEKIENNSWLQRNRFLTDVLSACEINQETGEFTLTVPKSKGLQRLFWSCGFYCKWVDDTAERTGHYNLFSEGILSYFHGDVHEAAALAVSVREPFRGVKIEKIEPVGDEYAYCIKVNHPLHLYITDDYIVTHNTFCAASAIANMGNRMVAFLKPKYLEKWVGDLKAILDIDPEDIELVQGSESLMRVISKAAEGTLSCKAILISNKTFQNYIKEYEKNGNGILDQGYDCLPHEFIQLTQCGVKLVDEVHEDFHLNFKIDLYTHVEWAISLSATLVNNDPFISSMHEVAYDKEIRYNGLPYDKYVESYAFKYRIVNGDRIRTTELGSNNYSHMAFEKSVYKDNKLLKDYLSLIEDRFITQYLTRMKRGQRCLIYAASIHMCTLIVEHLKKQHPDLDVRRYVEDDPYDNLMSADVCVSTIGSAGTGHDIKNLITVIMTVAIASKASNIQGFGRLRKLKDVDVIFEYFTCLDIPKHVEYYENKELLLSGMAKAMYKETLSMPIG